MQMQTISGKVNYAYVITLAVIAAIGGFLFGYDTAVISGTVNMVAEQFGLNDLSQGWYVGCALLGSIGGVACAGVLNDRCGRKVAMIGSAVLFTASAIGCALAPDFNSLVVYRIIGGVGIGVVSITSPLYISEVSVARYRGRMVSSYQLAITVGFLGAYLANYALLLYSADAVASAAAWVSQVFGTEVWRGMLGLEAVPAMLFLLCVLFIPESPRWLMLRNRDGRARSVIDRMYRSPEAAQLEYDSIKTSLAADAKSSTASQWSALRRPGILGAVVIGACIAILGQFMGVNAVLYYGPKIFEDAGLSSGDSLFYQVLVGSVNMGTSFLALLIIDKVGRKQLVYWGVSGMIASLLLIAAYFVWGEAWGLSSLLLLAFFLLYIFCCAISICAVIWVLLSEMYPTGVRGLAMSIAGFSLWIGTYLIGQLTPWLLQNLTPAGTFMLFAAMCIPYILIIRYLVPETTGLTLEQIEALWERKAPKASKVELQKID